MHILAEMNLYLVGLLVALFVIISVMMMLIVLIQRPQGGGLSEAFGSASGSGHTAFGAKTGDALTYATIIIFVAFIGFAIGLNYVVKPPQAAVIPVVSPVETTPPDGTPAPAGSAPAQPTNTEPAPAQGTTPPPPSENTDAPAQGTPPSEPK